jgi:predicted  nucleic acid-binding Zn-ribbon protein
MEALKKFISANLLSVLIMAGGACGTYAVFQRRLDELENKMASMELKIANVASAQDVAELRSSNRSQGDRIVRLEQAVDNMEKSATRIEAAVTDLRNFLLNNRTGEGKKF